MNRAQLAEIVLEDVAQIVLSVLVTLELNRWTPTSALNLATSVYNLLFDLLDIAEGDDNMSSSNSSEDNDDEQPSSSKRLSRQATPY